MELLKYELRRMLIEFINEIKYENWYGKERELISRFAFSKLVKNIGCCAELFAPEQIGIEVRVKQVTKGKKEVCKDLIIWRKSNQTAWSKENVPYCIMEWKHRKKEPSDYDIEWLKKYSQKNNDCFGIALNVENEKGYSLNAVLIEYGEITNNSWICIN